MLEYFQKHQFSLFPIPLGYKSGGKHAGHLVPSFVHDSTKDAAVWASWGSCNLGIYAAGSGLIIVDLDPKVPNVWALWWALCEEWNVPEAARWPHVQTPSGGWHVYFKIPEGVEPTSLRQRDAIKGIINTRCIGYTVAPGSYYAGFDAGTGEAKGQAGHYTLINEAAPYPAPQALLDHCDRKNNERKPASGKTGTRDKDDVGALVEWLAERHHFDAYEDWLTIGMALLLEFGDEGFSLWEKTFDDNPRTQELAEYKWGTFATEATDGVVTLDSFLKRANDAGWKGKVRQTSQAMFASVQDIMNQTLAGAAAAPVDPAVAAQMNQAGAMTGQTQVVIEAKGTDTVETFLELTNHHPSKPNKPGHPLLPDTLVESYPTLCRAMNAAIDRVAAMAEKQVPRLQQACSGVLGVLSQMHAPTFDALITYLTTSKSVPINTDKLGNATRAFEADVSHGLNPNRTTFYTDAKGKPDGANSDNVGIFLRRSDHEIRHDLFTGYTEVRRGSASFRRMVDYEFRKLLWLAKSTEFSYHPAKETLGDMLDVEAHETEVDSLEEFVLRLADTWDGVGRLDDWIHRTCSVVDGPEKYHYHVGRLLIGSMVNRALNPGCKQDETVIFISEAQGTGKSTLCKILALQDEWFLGSYKFGGSQQSSLPLLSGKWVVELGELAGMHKSDFEDVKSFLSETTDEYVAKYERFPTVKKRRCVFIGTSNVRQPLADPSGNRRFLPVHIPGEIDLEWIRANVAMIVGECAARMRAGEDFRIPREAWDTTKAVQESHRSMSPLEEQLYAWFDNDMSNWFISSNTLQHAFKLVGHSAARGYGPFMEKMGIRQFRTSTMRGWVKSNKHGVDISHCNEMLVSQTSATRALELKPTRTIQGIMSQLPPPRISPPPY